MRRVTGFARQFLEADLQGKRALSQHSVRRVVARVRYGNIARRIERNDEWVLARPLLSGGKETYLVSLRDSVISRYLLTDGEWEFDHFEQALMMLEWNHVDLLIDVGANIGTVCIPALRRGLAGRAVAVEPDTTNVTLLRANALINGVSDRLQVHDVAAAASSAELRLALDTEFSNFGDHQIVSAAGEVLRTITVPVRGECVDALVGAELGTRTLMWVDVQGYEGEVLAGAKSILGCGAALVMEFSPAHLALHGGLSGLHILSDYFTHFVDLRSGESSHLSMSTLTELAQSLGERHTDLLFIPTGHRVNT